MKVTVDRIENKIAVMLIRPEEEYSLEIPIKYIDVEIDEGDILNLNFEKLEKETKAAGKRVRDLLNKLKNN